MKEVTIEQLEKVKEELRAIVDYHVLTAAKYLADIHHIDDNVITPSAKAEGF